MVLRLIPGIVSLWLAWQAIQVIEHLTVAIALLP